jgi:hypothetical protein
MNGCPACQEAEHNPHTGIYQHGCMPCQARALAQSDEARARLRAPSELVVAMRKTWVSEADYRRGRSMVWDWIKRLEA